MNSQDKLTEVAMKAAISATIEGVSSWLQSEDVWIVEKRSGRILKNAELKSSGKGTLMDHVLKAFSEAGIEYSETEK